MADARAAMHRLSSLVGEGAIFENDAYRNLWLARVLSSTPSNAVVYTMLILVVNARDASFFSSLFVVAYILPSALFGTLSGVIVDRMPKSLVLAGTTAVRAALCVLLAISTESVLMIYVIAVFFAVGSQFSGPAEAAALPIVVKQEDLTSANSVNNLGGLIAQIIGLVVLPAVFLNTVGPAPLALVCAGLFAAATAFFLLVQGIGGPVSAVDITIDDTRERFAEAWHRLTLDAVSYVAVVIIVVANTVGLVVITLLPRYSTEVLGISAENAIFVAMPAALGIWLALRFVRNLSGRTSPWWSIGAPFVALLTGVTLLAFVPGMARALESLNPLWLFDPGPFGQDAARIIITGTLAGALAFAFTFVNVVGRSIVNERIPRDMQGRVFAAQSVLTTLASIPPILLTGIVADVVGLTPVFLFVAFSSAVLAAFFTARNLAMPMREEV